MDVSGQLHVPAALPPAKDPCYPLNTRLGGPQSRSGHGDEEKIPSLVVDWIHLAQDRDQWRTVITVMNIQVP
jgi:hypothetical protein